jgi:hypothetical protein
MAINFPISPTDGQTYTFVSRTWTYNLSANAWIATSTTLGYTGSVGYTGSSGAYAAVGFTGSAGYIGSVGYTGSSGAYAAVGYTGSAGTGGASVTVSNTAPISPGDGSLWFAPTINTLSIYSAAQTSWIPYDARTDDWGLITASVTVYDDYGSVV